MNEQEPAHPWVEGAGRVLIESARIKQRVRELGESLASELAGVLEAEGEGPADHGDRVVMLPVMTGAMVFTADLIRRMPVKLSMRLVTVSSYAGQTTESRGAAFRGVIPRDLGGRHVVIIDDILDTGRTLKLVRDIVLEQSPASVRSCVLLDKPERREVEITAEHVGFEIPDAFVVGYGLDYDGYYRNVPDIRVLDTPA